MPIAVKRNTVDTEDVTGKSYTLPYFNVFVFKKEIPILGDIEFVTKKKPLVLRQEKVPVKLRFLY